MGRTVREINGKGDNHIETFNKERERNCILAKGFDCKHLI